MTSSPFSASTASPLTVMVTVSRSSDTGTILRRARMATGMGTVVDTGSALAM